MFSVIESGIQFRLDRVPLRQMIAQRIRHPTQRTSIERRRRQEPILTNAHAH